MRILWLVALGLLGTIAVTSGSAGAASDPNCTASYGGAPPRSGAPLRFGIDPGIAGSAGGAQLPAVPDNESKDLAAVKALHPSGRALVVRLNRLFWSDGDAGITRFRKLSNAYTAAGFEVELQVRYHPASGEAGKIADWERYVRHVVDAFGKNRRVVAMTITNEVNLQVSPNTSDGYYKNAVSALIEGIEAAHAEAQRKHFHQLRFGFTYAYRFGPPQDAAFFAALAGGGVAFQKALGFVGLDFYPGSVYPPPPAPLPGDSYRAELAQAAGVVRACLAPKGRIGARVPIWITENGVPTGTLSEAQQATALRDLVRAAVDYSGTFNITDYRWFNLRDSNSSSPGNVVGVTFSSDGLMRSDYTPKTSFGAYRRSIAALGASAPHLRKHPHHRRQQHREQPG